MAPLIQSLNTKPNINQYYGNNQATGQTQKTQQPNFSAGTTQQNNQTEKIIQNNPILNAATEAPVNPTSFFLSTLGSFAVLLGINNFLNTPLTTQNYNNTIFKKIEKAGDKLAQKPIIKKVGNFLDKTQTTGKKIVNKSEVLRTLFYKESLGGPLVMDQAAGAKSHLAKRALEVMENYQKLTGYKGFDAILKKAKNESYKHYDEIISTIKNSGADINRVMTNRPIWSLKLLKNQSSLREILNKDILIQNYKGAGKTLGQRISGYLMRSTEALTNGVFSGLGQMLFQAIFIAQSVNEATKAEKGEKFQVFAASLAELMTFMATMGIQQRIINHIAGLKYVGLSPQNVEKYKEAIKLANEAAKSKNMAQYAVQVANAKNLRKLANVKWYQKPIKWIGDIASYGRIRETIKPLKGNFITNLFAKIPYGLKVGAGWVGRMALLIGIIIPLLAGISRKVSYSIFGKPVKTLEKEKQKELLEKQKEENPQIEQVTNQPKAQETKNFEHVAQITQQPKVNQGGPSSLYQKTQNLKNQSESQFGDKPIASQPIASAPISTSPDAGIKRSYIPNPILGVEKSPIISQTRTAQIDKIMRQADIAEMQANRYL